MMSWIAGSCRLSGLGGDTRLIPDLTPSCSRDVSLTASASAFSFDDLDVRIVGHARLDHVEVLWEQFGETSLSGARNDHGPLLARLWHAHGIDLFALLEGDFAIALWIRASRQLILARDVMGHRPLHYGADGERLCFASYPLDVARELGRVEPDYDQLVAYLALMPEVGDASFISGIKRVLPGHVVIANDAGVTQRAYWRPDLSPSAEAEPEAIARLEREFDRAVGAALNGKVIASQLSGGLDSSLIIASAARQASPEKRLVAITGVASRVDEQQSAALYVDEAEVAAETAAMLGVEHRQVHAEAEPPLEALDRWLPTLQRPVLNACNLGWLDATFAAAREIESPTLLQGLMGNFTISHDGLARLPAMIRRGEWVTFLREAKAYMAYSGARWTGLGAMAFGWAVPASVFRGISRWRGTPFRELGDGTFLRTTHMRVRALNKRARRIKFDLSFRLPPDDSPKHIIRELWFADPGLINASVLSRFGVELIDPMAARRVAETCLRMPSSTFFRDGVPRRVAKALLAGKVPSRVLDEKRRGYQGSNWRAGIEASLQQLINEVDDAERFPELSELFDLPAMRDCFLHWPTSGWENLDQVQRYRRDLIRAAGALRFLRWLREEAAAG